LGGEFVAYRLGAASRLLIRLTPQLYAPYAREGVRLCPCRDGLTKAEVDMNSLGWIVLALIWISLAFWPARVANRKGHSFMGFFILSLFFWPLALIVAYAVSDRRAIQTR
jgi:hypothetical protein